MSEKSCDTNWEPHSLMKDGNTRCRIRLIDGRHQRIMGQYNANDLQLLKDGGVLLTDKMRFELSTKCTETPPSADRIIAG